MHLPEQFAEHRTASQLNLIRRAPLGTLVITGENGFEANHIPFVHRSVENGYGTLCAHVPRVNPVTRMITAETEALVIFHGPEGYVSPAWYATKQEHGRVVPTWNYAVVHAHGRARLIEEGEWIRSQLDELTDQMERHREEPWSVADAPAAFTDSLIGSLVGLEIRIERLEAKVKASQNQPEANQRSVLAALDTEQHGSEFTALMHGVLDEASD